MNASLAAIIWRATLCTSTPQREGAASVQRSTSLPLGRQGRSRRLVKGRNANQTMDAPRNAVAVVKPVKLTEAQPKTLIVAFS